MYVVHIERADKDYSSASNDGFIPYEDRDCLGESVSSDYYCTKYETIQEAEEAGKDWLQTYGREGDTASVMTVVSRLKKQSVVQFI